MSRLVGLFGSLFAYFCVGTVLAQGLLVGYVVMEGKVDKRKLIDMLAVAHGLELDPESDFEATPEKHSTEQASLRENRSATAELTRDLELKHQLLQSSKTELERIKTELVSKVKEFQSRVQDFVQLLNTEKKLAANKAQIEVVNILQTSKPKQAKTQLMLMWNRDEKDRVVNLVTAMPERSRKKIVAEFKTEEDDQTLSEILKLIGEGGAIVNLVENTQEEFENDQTRRK